MHYRTGGKWRPRRISNGLYVAYNDDAVFQSSVLDEDDL